MKVINLGTMPYRDAWALQEQHHDAVVAGGEAVLLLVEHPPVITFGRRSGQECNLLASQETLAKMNVDLVQSDRGGDVTFHGSGQIVAYPILRLNDYHLSVGAYVQRLEDVVISTLKYFQIHAYKDSSAIGIWVNYSDNTSAKICALGVRIRKGTTLHGIALNVNIDLRYFNLIVPCGLATRPVTSMQQLLSEPEASSPGQPESNGSNGELSQVDISRVRDILTREFQSAFTSPVDSPTLSEPDSRP